jgi:hypothetical protein
MMIHTTWWEECGTFARVVEDGWQIPSLLQLLILSGLAMLDTVIPTRLRQWIQYLLAAFTGR